MGKHRKHPAGRGKAGGLTHQRTNIFKYHPGHFGKKGIRVFRRHFNREYCPTVNVDKLFSLLSEPAQLKLTKDSKDSKDAKDAKAPVIDVTKMGFHKVLGRGRLPHFPFVVKAKFFSTVAQRRIRAAGGACILTG